MSRLNKNNKVIRENHKINNLFKKISLKGFIFLRKIHIYLMRTKNDKECT
jgi:hypothetical protein